MIERRRPRWRALAIAAALAVPAGASTQERSHATITLGRGQAPPPAAVPDIYTVERGDTLWDITGRFFGNPYEWPRVWSYNPEITNPHWIYPLDRVRLRAGATAAPSEPVETVRRTAARRPGAGSIRLRDQGYLDAEALRDAGLIVGSPEEQMLLTTHDDVYVRFDENAQVQVGREYTIYRQVERRQREPEEIGTLVRIYGAVRLRSYDRDRNVGRATIIDALDPIERGFRIAPIPRRFDIVPPRENTIDLQAKVVASLRPARIHADQQIVFIDVGSEQGVRVGNRFFVVRVGDLWRESLGRRVEYGQEVRNPPRLESSSYPPEVIAEGRVVNVREETSTLYITGAAQEIEVGDLVEMRAGF